MSWIVKFAVVSTLAVSSMAASVEAADCDDAKGTREMDNDTQDINGFCSSLVRQHPAEDRLVGNDMVCHASSSNGNYDYCQGALENIVSVCSNHKHGWWSYGGQTYECVGYYEHDDGFCKVPGAPEADLCI